MMNSKRKKSSLIIIKFIHFFSQAFKIPINNKKYFFPPNFKTLKIFNILKY